MQNTKKTKKKAINKFLQHNDRESSSPVSEILWAPEEIKKYWPLIYKNKYIILNRILCKRNRIFTAITRRNRIFLIIVECIYFFTASRIYFLF